MKDTSEKYKPDLTTEEVEKEILILKNSIKVNFISTGDHARSLETDNYKITFDPGFDFVNREYIAEKHNVIIDIRKINNS